MSLFSLFKKKKPTAQIKKSSAKINYNFTDECLMLLIDKSAIVFLDNKEKETDYIIACLCTITNGDAKCANALYNFIPLVLCQKIFPEPEYSDSYMVFKDKDDCTEYLLNNNQIYNSVEKYFQNKLNNNQLSEDEMYAILAHSSTFNVLNQALNGGSNIEDLALSPSVFFDLE